MAHSFFPDEGNVKRISSEKVLKICAHAINMCDDELFGKKTKSKSLNIDEVYKLLRISGEAYSMAVDVVLSKADIAKALSNEDIEEEEGDWHE